MSPENNAAAVGGLLVVLTMVVCYIVLLVFDPRGAAEARADGFTPAPAPAPWFGACSSRWLSERQASCVPAETRGFSSFSQ